MSFELLKRLCDAHGVSGREGDVAAVIRGELEAIGLQAEEDAVGNLIVDAWPGAPESLPAALIDGHMDEIGLMVSHVHDNGAIAFATLGGWDERVLPAQEVTIRTRERGMVRGVIGSKPPHILSGDEKSKPLKVESLWIDVGTSSAEETRALGVEMGDPVVLDGEMIEMRPGVIRGKALDDRVGCYLALETLRAVKPKAAELGYHLFASFSTGEEVGTRGIRAVGGRRAWAASLHLESTVAGDVPFTSATQCPTVMGKGPAITIADRSLIVPEKMVRFLEGVARRNSIPFQFKKPIFGGTNAGAMSQTGGGVLCGVIATPTRYIHSPVTLLRWSDLEAARELVGEAVLNMREILS